MYGTKTMMTGFQQSLVDQTIAVPSGFIIMRLRQRNGFPNETSEGIGLWERLTIQLIYPRLWTVCGDHN